jgi:hypothetical protein
MIRDITTDQRSTLHLAVLPQNTEFSPCFLAHIRYAAGNRLATIDMPAVLPPLQN